MTVPDLVVLVLLCVAGAVFAIAIAGMLLARSTLDKLHFMAALTSVVTPLVAIAAAVQGGVSLSSATTLLIGAMVAVSGPVLTMAVGRVIEQERSADAGEATE